MSSVHLEDNIAADRTQIWNWNRYIAILSNWSLKSIGSRNRVQNRSIDESSHTLGGPRAVGGDQGKTLNIGVALRTVENGSSFDWPSRAMLGAEMP